MELWILRPNINLSVEDNPWVPWFDKVFSFVIRAETEAEARAWADVNGADENNCGILHPWLNPKYSTCKILKPEGPSTLIVRHLRSA